MEKKEGLLVLNAGSYSLKFALFTSPKKKIIEGKCDCIGNKNSYIEYSFNFNNSKNENKKTKKRDYILLENYEKSLKKISDVLESNGFEFGFIAHRIVHGGSIDKPKKINKSVKKIIKDYSVFAPLHNPLQLNIIKICRKFGKKQFAAFDTSLYSDIPETSKIIPIPEKITKKHSLRNFGFHGLSHSSVINQLEEIKEKKDSKNNTGKTITCHLGSGSSITAFDNGKAIENSMGMTPLKGLVMNSRSGDLDPGLIVFLKNKGYKLEKILNKESGLRAFTKNPDMRDIIKNLDNKKTKLGFDLCVYSIIKYIGAYTAVLNGLDNLIFTGGIGENIYQVRKEVVESLGYLGCKIDSKKNKNNNKEISSKNSKVKVYVLNSDEESEIARQVYSIK